MSGNSRTGSRKTLMMPKRTSARLIMVASTGRSILTREMVISPLLLRCGSLGRQTDRTARNHLLQTFDDHLFARLHAFEHFDQADQANAGLYLAHLSVVIGVQ